MVVRSSGRAEDGTKEGPVVTDKQREGIYATLHVLKEVRIRFDTKVLIHPFQ